MHRRSLLLAALGWPLSGLGRTSDPLRGLRRWGSAPFRRFGFLVYEATLWAGDNPLKPPLALRLDYKRTIAGRAIAEASVKEMQTFVDDPVRLARWGEQMARIFPDVRKGDHILGVLQADGATFYQGERLIGALREADFALAFFSIWLDPRTSAPALREALLRPAQT